MEESCTTLDPLVDDDLPRLNPGTSNPLSVKPPSLEAPISLELCGSLSADLSHLITSTHWEEKICIFFFTMVVKILALDCVLISLWISFQILLCGRNLLKKI